jgi:serine-type D-Ala-D-Ala carboxypeptidase (penicillin-binding protein 5/6)
MSPRRLTTALLAGVLVAGACSSDRGAGTTATLGGLPAGTTAEATSAAPGTPAPATTVAITPTLAPSTTAAPTTTGAPATTARPPRTTAAPPTTLVPAVDVEAYAVFDMRSGRLLAAKRRHAPLPVGSLMKLLTAKVAYNAGEPTRVVTIPEGLLIDPEESNIGLIPGEELPRDVLIRAMLIVSANDAARALARDIAGDEAAYAELMNQAAGELGLQNTHAVNVTGLDAEGQHSSAMDMIRLGTHLMTNPSFQLTVERTDAVLHDLSYPATNDLLNIYPGADGIKSGRTTQAGWCLLGSATRAGRRIVVAVLGAPTEAARNDAAVALLDWGFTQ